MALFGWFNKKEKKNNIQVDKKTKNSLHKAAAAVAFAEAGEHDTARSLMGGKIEGHNTILVIGNEDNFTKNLMNYAVNMAKRLDFELIALNVIETPLIMNTEKREKAVNTFRENCILNVTKFQDAARKSGVPFTHLIEVGNEDETIKRLQEIYPGMRYALTEPDDSVKTMAEDHVAIPVFHLGSFQTAAVAA